MTSQMQMCLACATFCSRRAGIPDMRGAVNAASGQCELCQQSRGQQNARHSLKIIPCFSPAPNNLRSLFYSCVAKSKSQEFGCSKGCIYYYLFICSSSTFFFFYWDEMIQLIAGWCSKKFLVKCGSKNNSKQAMKKSRCAGNCCRLP